MSIDAEPQTTERWCRPVGLRELGQAQGSGLREPSYLLQRADGQVLQLSELLHLVVREVSAERDTQKIAHAVSQAYGRELTVDGLRRVLATKLEPLGLVENLAGQDTEPPALVKSDPVLSLRLRGTILPASAVRVAAKAMAPLFRPLVIAGALILAITADVLVFRQGGLINALSQIWATPTWLLALLGLLAAGALIHELGHAAACRYGGAQPGVIGFGVYLVFPAFFTNVSDSYRLDRPGRIRTDLGGLYLNVWCLIVLGGSYLLTGNGILLLALLLMHIEMLQQLVPTVRFDGYFVLADLAGVPDLFARVRPVLLSLIPARSVDPRVKELRATARRIVTGWVLVVVPMLAFGAIWLALTLPYLISHSATSIEEQAQAFASGWDRHDVATMLLAIISIALVTLPFLGLMLLAHRLLSMLLRVVRRLRPTRPGTEGNKQVLNNAATSAQENKPRKERRNQESGKSAQELLSAAAFTDDLMIHRRRATPPEGGWRRAVYTVSAGSVNPGPSAAERRRAEILGRVTRPIEGSHRVAVMSRKGGVGKTTITLALGSTFAMLRGDRVVAVDANPDAGNLAHRVANQSDKTITDVLGSMDVISSYADLRAFTSQAADSRLEVLASDDDPRIGMALNRDSYHRVIELLDHYYNLILLDTGTGILDSANQGLLAEADQLVVVLRPALDGARAAALTLDWLSEHGFGELVASAVVVLNATRKVPGIDLDQVADHFSRRCAKVLSVPWDRALENGAQTTLSALQPETRHALVEVAASVADHFAAQSYVRHDNQNNDSKRIAL